MLNSQSKKEIQEKLGYTYQDESLLNLAFTHSSYGNINGVESNERLEFLGDSVLHFATTQYLFHNFNLPEGLLSKTRSYVVSAKNLSKAINELGVISYLQYGKNDGKITSSSIKANLYEAILASIYLDAGFEVAYNFVLRTLHYKKGLFEDLMENTNDYKTKLQELTQVKKENKLTYELIKKEGPPHAPIFTIQVKLNGKVVGTGVGKNKKEAENNAAREALKQLL